MPGKVWRYDRSQGRTFNRAEGKRFGYDVGLEDRLILQSLASKDRRLDQKKMMQLANIYQARLADLVETNDTLAEYKLAFSGVKVNQSFSEITVSWVARGEGDDEIRSVLEVERHSIRRQLAEMLSTTVPEIKFKADMTQLKLDEMEALFKKADYGMDYRSISSTGRVMGRVEEKKEEKEEKVKEIPEWKKRLEEKKRIEDENSQTMAVMSDATVAKDVEASTGRIHGLEKEYGCYPMTVVDYCENALSSMFSCGRPKPRIPARTRSVEVGAPARTAQDLS